MRLNKILAFTQDFVSFLIEDLEGIESIDKIILFGSTARQSADINSDIDIFIDTRNKGLEKKIYLIRDKFYNSIKYLKYWKLQGIKNKLNVHIGELDKWDLKRSIISDGITLFGKYEEKPKSIAYSLFKINLTANRNKKVGMWRKIYGYKQKVGKKVYDIKGLIERYGGKKLAPTLFIVPLLHSQDVINFLRKEKVNHQIIEIWSDAKIGN